MNLHRFFILFISILFLTACNDKSNDKELPMSQAGVIEIVIYQTKPGIKDIDHIKRASIITPILANLNGFISRQFSKSTDGKWIDIIFWKNMQLAEKAAIDVKSIPECQVFFEDIDDKNMEFMHSKILNHYP